MKGLTFIAGIGIAVAVAAAGADEPEWYIATVDDYENDVGASCSLALDGDEYPHVAYWDSYNHGPRYAYFDGSAWRISLVERQDRGGSNSLALDARGRPHIAYEHCTSFEPYGADLKYAYYDGSSWRIEVVDDSGYSGSDNSVALDTSGRPHIAYSEYINTETSNLKYAFFDGEKWQITCVDRGDVGQFISLALDSNNRAHISYRDDEKCYLKYARYDGSRWHTETVDTSLATGKGTSVALDSADRPHISYQEDLTDALKYARYDGSRWHIEVVDDDHVNAKTSLALDARDRPHITYCAQWGTGGPHWTSELRYAYFDGAAWHKEVIDVGGEDETLGGWNSLALDAAGTPHVAYDRSVGMIDTIWSLKYACQVGGYLKQFTATPQAYDALALKWSVKEPLGSRVTAYNLYRREKGEEEWVKITETPLAGGGSGSYDDGGLACLRCYEYLLEGIVEGRPRQLGITEGTTTVPQAYVLHNARPNPWSSKAVIAFELRDRADVDLSVYDLSGRKVATLAEGWLPPGAYEREVSALAPGVYVYRLEAGGWAGARKMVVVR